MSLLTPAKAALAMSIMNGKLSHTLNRQTKTLAWNGLSKGSNRPSPRWPAITGTGLPGVATSQFQAVEDTTTGTIQGNRRRVLNKPLACTLLRNSIARPRPMTQLPKTPTTQKMSVNSADCQNWGLLRSMRKSDKPTKEPALRSEPLWVDWNPA